MLRNGFFYQLSDRTWHQQKFPPHIAPRIGLPSDSLHTFRGKPTYFGAPTCDENVECRYTEILQYQDRNFDWIKLGNMVESRRNHEVIEIPAEFCQTGATTTTTTVAPATTNNPPADQIDTVAMIIGGAANRETGMGILNSVELFGCPNTNTISVWLENINVPLYLTAGVYYEDENKVVVCGGNQCQNLASKKKQQHKGLKSVQ